LATVSVDTCVGLTGNRESMTSVAMYVTMVLLVCSFQTVIAKEFNQVGKYG